MIHVQVPYSPNQIVNSLLSLAKKLNIDDITPMKLQKLLYFAQGWSLVNFPKPLINEFFEAWEYGPVCPSVYYEFKPYGGVVIPFDKKMLGDGFTKPLSKSDQVEEEVEKFLQSVLSVYGKYTGTQLSAATHYSDELNPWIKARKESGGMKGFNIDNDKIKEYFVKLKESKRLW